MKGRTLPYSAAELAWIEARKTDPRRQAHAAFLTAFDRSDVSLSNFISLCKRKGWLTGRTGQYAPGQTSANKGKTMPFNANTTRTQFKKGRVPSNFRGPGHERIDRNDGYVVLIVDEPNPWNGHKTRPVLKHRYLWEKLHGPLPDGMCLKCLDGDKTNTAPSNWEAIPRALLPRLNGRFGRGYDQAAPEVKPAIMATVKLAHAARTLRQRSANRSKGQKS